MVRLWEKELHMRICPQCKKEKSPVEFGRLKSSKDGLRNECKLCRKKYYLKPTEQVAEWNLRRKERMKEMGLLSKDRKRPYKEKQKQRETLKKKYENYDYTPSIIKRHYSTYCRSWHIDFETFRDLIHKDCFYCGRKPDSKRYSSNREKFIFVHGIDRIDNEKGYEKDNIVTCCKICNYSKRDMNVEDFKIWIKDAYNNLFIRKG